MIDEISLYHVFFTCPPPCPSCPTSYCLCSECWLQCPPPCPSCPTSYCLCSECWLQCPPPCPSCPTSHCLALGVGCNALLPAPLPHCLLPVLWVLAAMPSSLPLLPHCLLPVLWVLAAMPSSLPLLPHCLLPVLWVLAVAAVHRCTLGYTCSLGRSRLNHATSTV